MAIAKSPSKALKRWTSEADLQFLLLLVMMYVNKGTINYHDVAARLGDGSTANAIEHRMRKLRGPQTAGARAKKGVKKEETEEDEMEVDDVKGVVKAEDEEED